MPDGGLVLETKPDPNAKPLMEIPKGYRVERQGEVTIQPNPKEDLAPIPGSHPTENQPQLSNPSLMPQTPFKIQWSLVSKPDGTERVIFRSNDGTILDGVDVPVRQAAPPPKELKYAAGASYNPADKTYGAWVTRDLGPFRLGLDVYQQRTPGIESVRTDFYNGNNMGSTVIQAVPAKTAWAGMIKVGLRF